MKKILIIIASFLMLATFASCQKNNADTFVGSEWQFTNKYGDDMRLTFTTETEVRYTYSNSGDFKGEAVGTYVADGENAWNLSLKVPKSVSIIPADDLSIVRAWIKDDGKMRIDAVRCYFDLTRIK